jgi:hypothetical protein
MKGDALEAYFERELNAQRASVKLCVREWCAASRSVV